MEEKHVTIQEFKDKNEPQRSCNDYDRHDALFRCPSKRWNLDECIRHIYIVNDNWDELPTDTDHTAYNRYQITQSLNRLVRQCSPPHPARDTAVERVKRRLFREPKLMPRKSKNPQKSTLKSPAGFFFQVNRLGVIKKVRRGYLSVGRKIVQRQIALDRKRKRKVYEWLQDHSASGDGDTVEASHPEAYYDQQDEKTYRHYINTLHRMQDEILRSTFYIDYTLLNLLYANNYVYYQSNVIRVENE